MRAGELRVVPGTRVQRGEPVRGLALVVLVSLVLAQSALYPLAEASSSGSSRFWGIAVHKKKAIPLGITVELYPGSGRVYIEGVKYGPLFKESLVEALYMAAWSEGLDPWSLDYRVIIEPARSEAIYLKGSSLSLSVYLAAVAAIRGDRLKESIMVTGTLNPDLTVGLVGNVREKALGAQEWNYTAFIYPMLQSSRYEVRNVPRHIGPYTFMTTMVLVEPENFTGINVSLREAGWAPDAYLAVTGHSLAAIHYMSLETMASKALDSITAWDKLSRVLEFLEEDTLRYLSRANESLLGDARLTQNPMARSYAYQLILESSRMLGYYKLLKGRGLLFAAAEYLLYSYDYAVRAYYYLRFLQDNILSVDEARADLVSKSLLVQAVLKTSITGDLVNAYSLPALAEASLSYYEASRYYRTLDLDLTLLSGGFYSRSLIAYSASRLLAQVLEGYMKALMLANMADAAVEGPEVNLSMVAPRFVAYAGHLFNYMREVSLYTGVNSELISLAGSNWWLAKTLLRNSNDALVMLAALGYSLRSIAYSSLYMVLHPGFEGVGKARYPYALRTLVMLAEHTGFDPMSAYVLQLGVLYDDPANRLYYVERALAYIKLLITIGARTSSGGMYATEYTGMQKYTTGNQSNNLEDKDTADRLLESLELSKLAGYIGLPLAVIIATVTILINKYRQSRI